MEQTLDLAKLTLGQMKGEHFLRVEASETLAQVVDKLRDHQCAAAIYADSGNWWVVSAEILPELLLKGLETLQQPVSSLAQPLNTLSQQDSLKQLHSALGSHTWVGALQEGTVVGLLHWTSWARFAATHRLTHPYLFSPEWGHDPATLAKV